MTSRAGGGHQDDARVEDPTEVMDAVPASDPGTEDDAPAPEADASDAADEPGDASDEPDEPGEASDEVDEPAASEKHDQTPLVISDEGDDPDDPPHARSGRWGLWVGLGAAVLVAGAYVVAAFFAAGRVPVGTHVLGVDLGGLERDAAIAALQPAADTVEATPVVLTVEDREASVEPTAAGLAINVDATVDSQISFSLAPARVLRGFTGAEAQVEPVTAVDRDALVDAIDGVSEQLAAGAQDATVEVSAEGAQAMPGTDGIGVDAEAAADGLAQDWPVETFEAPTAPVEPAITTAAAEEFAAELNETTFAGDVLLAGENGDATVTSAQMVENATVAAEDAELTLVVDGGPIAAALEAANPALVSQPSAASFSFDGAHQLQVVNSRPGRAIDADALGEAIVAAATSADRTGELPYRDTEAAITDENSGIGDFKQIVSSFSTPVPYNPTRTRNLIRGAELITGTVVKPGERFDLSKVLSPIDGTNGYVQAGVIVNGLHTDAYGGGLSQVSTTAYNAGYFAGMEIVAHRPHSVWFSRYPAGRESTIYVGSINMVFENTTPYALVMSAFVENGKITVEIWSTPHFTVKTYASEKTNIKPISTVEVSGPDCEAYSGGEAGFTITNTREVYLGDQLVDKTSETWTYRPDNAVKCV